MGQADRERGYGRGSWEGVEGAGFLTYTAVSMAVNLKICMFVLLMALSSSFKSEARLRIHILH